MADSKSSGRSESKLQKPGRATLTRQQLLLAARAIFARDGFEHARLEDIAARAGKTRGAFYANFKDKEDAFCAIFEENMTRNLAELGPLLVGLSTLAERVNALGDYLGVLSKDREWILLNLEFKLYAIRHPRRRKRLADLHGMMRLRAAIPEISELLPQLQGGGTQSHLVESLAIGGILDGLALSHLFDPEILSTDEVCRYLKLCLLGGAEAAAKTSVASRKKALPRGAVTHARLP